MSSGLLLQSPKWRKQQPEIFMGHNAENPSVPAPARFGQQTFSVAQLILPKMQPNAFGKEETHKLHPKGGGCSEGYLRITDWKALRKTANVRDSILQWPFMQKGIWRKLSSFFVCVF